MHQTGVEDSTPSSCGDLLAFMFSTGWEVTGSYQKRPRMTRRRMRLSFITAINCGEEEYVGQTAAGTVKPLDFF